MLSTRRCLILYRVRAEKHILTLPLEMVPLGGKVGGKECEKNPLLHQTPMARTEIVPPLTPLKLSLGAKCFLGGGDNFTGEGRYIINTKRLPYTRRAHCFAPPDH